VEYMEEYVHRYPGADLAWSAQSWIVKYIENLKDDGKIPANKADLRIEEAYQRLLTKHPEHISKGAIYRELGRLHFRAGRWETALSWYERFLTEVPTDMIPREVYEMGACYEQLGESAMAASAYDEFLQGYPDLPQSDTIRKQLRRIRGGLGQ
jgi:regulator of sirC expression with transglutaminase-like and TPR domain